jgi:pyruvate formate lyase activating enzyme
MLTIFNIQRFSIQDGNGIRTNIFFKGCPLHCMWCNNPESIDPFPSLMFEERSCQRFGDCITSSNGTIYESEGRLVIERGKIHHADSLKDVCPSGALSVAGHDMSIDEIVAEVEKDIPFFERSGGGVTISGGEPLAQGEELGLLLARLKQKGIHISAETSLHIPWNKISCYSSLIDIFLADLKHTDARKFLDFTGGDLDLVLSNFRNLDREGMEYIVRIPVVPGFNHTEPEIFAMIDFVAALKYGREINFIPYHSLAVEKYHMLGKDYTYSGYRNVSKPELKAYVSYAEQKGVAAEILNQ